MEMTFDAFINENDECEIIIRKGVYEYVNLEIRNPKSFSSLQINIHESQIEKITKSLSELAVLVSNSCSNKSDKEKQSCVA